MNNTQYQNRWDDSSQAKRLRFTLYFSLLKGIDDYSVPGKRWLSSMSLGLLVILVGIIGIIPMAKADEVSPEAETEGWQLGKAEGRGQRAEGRRQKAEGRRQKAEGRRQKAEGRRQKAVIPMFSAPRTCLIRSTSLPLPVTVWFRRNPSLLKPKR